MENAITCHACSKIYKNKATYNQHITYKRCNKILIAKPIDNTCQYCTIKLATKQSKNRHETKCHKNINLELEQKIKMVNDTLLEIKEMTGKNIVEYPLDVVPHSPASQQIANTINNNTINNGVVNNIIINSFGSEDTSYITNKQIIKALKMCKEFPLEMIKITHFNKDKPENHNIYKPNFKDKYVKYFNDNIWKIGDAKRIMTELYMSKMDIAEEKFDELKKYLSEITQGRFQWFLDNREEPEVMSEVLKKIAEMLYNERGCIND
jgi:phosphopantetheine adenylyltransferase